MKTKSNPKIDFTKIEWDTIDFTTLQFFFKEAVDYNDILLHDINNLNNKAFQLLTVAITAFSAAIGFLLATWGKAGKEAVAITLLTACIGIGLIVAFLLLAVFPRHIYPGRITPNILFGGILYKAPRSKLMADGIASYNTYIRNNHKVMKYRSFFLTAGSIGFFVVPMAAIIMFCSVF